MTEVVRDERCVMNQFNVAGLTPRVGTGSVQRDVQSKAGDGFKNLFSKLSNEPEVELPSATDEADFEAELLETGDDVVELQEEVSDDDFEAEDIHDDQDLEFTEQENSEDNEPDLEEIVDKLESAEELTDEEVEVLVDEVKELLKDPEVASKIRDILERAGLDLGNLSETDLRNALEALPPGLRDELVEVLSTEELTLTSDTVAAVLSEALGQLKQEFREAEEQERPPERRSSKADQLAKRFDRFLQKSEARAEKIDELGNKLLDGQAKKSAKVGQVLQFLANQGDEGALQPAGEGSSTTPDALAQATVTPQATVTAKIGAVPAPAADGNAPVQGTTGPEGKAAKAKALAQQHMPKSNLATQAEKSKMMQRLMAQARLHLKDGEGRFQIRLEPPNLGAMRISIENREGMLSAVITTDNDAARQTLQQNIGGLKAALAEQGVDVGEFDVQVDQQARDQQFARSRQGRQRRRDNVEKRLVALAERRKQAEEQREQEIDTHLGDGLLSLKA